MTWKEWVKKQMGIKSPSKHFFESQAQDWTKIGGMITEGIAQGIKDTTAFGTQTVDQATREELFSTVEASARVQKVIGCSMDQAIELIQVAKDAGMDKTDMSTVSTPTKDNHTIIDPLLKEIGQVVWDQQEKVLRSGKYEHPIHRTNHTAMEWMDHQMSEFADALVYRECLKQTIEEVAQAISLARSLNQAQEHSATRDRVDHYLGSALDRLGKG